MEKTTRRRVSILISALLLTLTCVLSLFAGAASAAESFNITRLTTDGDNHHPQVSGDRVVWESFDGNDREIFTWTPSGGVVQLTANDQYDGNPQVSGHRIVWAGNGAESPDVFVATRDFSDVPVGHPYREAVMGMADRGIISGYTSGTFGLDDPVKRAQFAKMIVGTLGITPGTSTATRFTDLGAPDAKGYPTSSCRRPTRTTSPKAPTSARPYSAPGTPSAETRW